MLHYIADFLRLPRIGYDFRPRLGLCGGSVLIDLLFWRCTSWSSGVYCTRRPWPKIGRSYGVRLPVLITFARCSLNASLPSFPLTGQFVTSAVIRILSPSVLQQKPTNEKKRPAIYFDPLELNFAFSWEMYWLFLASLADCLSNGIPFEHLLF